MAFFSFSTHLTFFTQSARCFNHSGCSRSGILRVVGTSFTSIAMAKKKKNRMKKQRKSGAEEAEAFVDEALGHDERSLHDSKTKRKEEKSSKRAEAQSVAALLCSFFCMIGVSVCTVIAVFVTTEGLPQPLPYGYTDTHPPDKSPWILPALRRDVVSTASAECGLGLAVQKIVALHSTNVGIVDVGVTCSEEETYNFAITLQQSDDTVYYRCPSGFDRMRAKESVGYIAALGFKCNGLSADFLVASDGDPSFQNPWLDEAGLSCDDGYFISGLEVAHDGIGAIGIRLLCRLE